jgi:hypothetical protein
MLDIPPADDAVVHNRSPRPQEYWNCPPRGFAFNGARPLPMAEVPEKTLKYCPITPSLNQDILINPWIFIGQPILRMLASLGPSPLHFLSP